MGISKDINQARIGEKSINAVGGKGSYDRGVRASTEGRDSVEKGKGVKAVNKITRESIANCTKRPAGKRWKTRDEGNECKR